ncbi:hypothetical protein N657DRAFT_644575 [Parathielavia appendiculata]|uniref:Uncharacterized protein n=1 Tax=Parathielavia appendiculata TaxID=2587402 RepID=A0AAN6U0Z4_9PEZI|nr:hypothetical protein N657DRAFT_644575 [Parathielavia appendiculata]
MESGPPYPVSRWPYKPNWELKGFDFSLMPVAQYRNPVSSLGTRRFTTGIANPRHPLEEDPTRFSRSESHNAVFGMAPGELRYLKNCSCKLGNFG